MKNKILHCIIFRFNFLVFAQKLPTFVRYVKFIFMKNPRLFIAFLVAMGGLVLIANQKKVAESTGKNVPPLMGAVAWEAKNDLGKPTEYSESLKEFLKGFPMAKYPFVVDERTMSFLKMQKEPDWKKVRQIDERFTKFAPRIREAEFSRIPRELKGFYVAKIAENKDFAAVIYATADFGYEGYDYETNNTFFRRVDFTLTTYAPNGDIIDELEVANLFSQDYNKRFVMSKDLQISITGKDYDNNELKEFYQIDKKGSIKKLEKDAKEGKKTDYYF